MSQSLSLLALIIPDFVSVKPDSEYRQVKPDSEYHIVNHPSQLTFKDYELIIWPNGNKLYYLNAQLHRENAPAILEKNAFQAWWIHNKRHRLSRLRLGLKPMAQL